MSHLVLSVGVGPNVSWLDAVTRREMTNASARVKRCRHEAKMSWRSRGATVLAQGQLLGIYKNIKRGISSFVFCTFLGKQESANIQALLGCFSTVFPLLSNRWGKRTAAERLDVWFIYFYTGDETFSLTVDDAKPENNVYMKMQQTGFVTAESHSTWVEVGRRVIKWDMTAWWRP